MPVPYTENSLHFTVSRKLFSDNSWADNLLDILLSVFKWIWWSIEIKCVKELCKLQIVLFTVCMMNSRLTTIIWYVTWHDMILMRTSDPVLCSSFHDSVTAGDDIRDQSLKENPCLPEFAKIIVKSVLKDFWRVCQCSPQKDFWKISYTVEWIFLFYHLGNLTKFWLLCLANTHTTDNKLSQGCECNKKGASIAVETPPGCVLRGGPSSGACFQWRLWEFSF